MFLMFHLQRMDVFSIGDLGVQRGFEEYIKQRPYFVDEMKSVDWTVPLDNLHSPGKTAKAQNRKPATKQKNGSKSAVPIHRQMEYVSRKFHPYRSAFQMVLWKLAATNVTVLEEKAIKAKAKAAKIAAAAS
jgi:DNA-3-methyladenine glycosylase II